MKKVWASVLVVLAGLLIVGAAVFAHQIGLDHNTAWGKGRVMLLAAGLLILLTPISFWGFKKLETFIVTYSAILRSVSFNFSFALLVLLVIVAYIWFISVGRWTYWPPTTNYYDRLAKAFQEGHLYLDAKIDPTLLALPNPYNPDDRRNIIGLDAPSPESIWDMALYNGKVYLYWGPAPALILALIKFLYSQEIGDQILTFIFVSGLFMFQALFLIRIWRRCFKQLPVWIVFLALILAAFAYPILWILNTPRIYEAAIVSGQFFFIGGLFFAFIGLDRPNVANWRLAFAGTFLTFALGSRATMGLAVLFVFLTVILSLLKFHSSTPSSPSERLKRFASLLTPLLVGVIGLGWYNLARFGSVFEFGFRYEITMLDQNRLYNFLFSPEYIFPNFYLYLFNPPAIMNIFPFLRPLWNREFISNFNDHFHTIYNAENIVGLIYAAPVMVFALIPAATIATGFVKKLLRKVGDLEISEFDQRAELFHWLIATLLGCIFFEFLTVLLVFYGTVRYFMDVAPTLTLLSVIGIWQGYIFLERNSAGRLSYAILAVLLMVVSIVISILLAISSDLERIRLYNPQMFTHMRLFFIHLLKSFK